MKIMVAVAVLAGMGGAAFAGGSATGLGTADAVDDALPITVNQTSVVTGLAPGLAAQPLKGNFDNPNEAPVYVSNVTATVTEVQDSAVVPSPAAMRPTSLLLARAP